MRARPTGRITAAAGGLVASLIVAVASVFYVFGTYLPTFNTPHTVVEGVRFERSELSPAPALARRLWVVVVDGLGDEVARTLPTLAPLRTRGAYRRMEADYLTFTSPAIVTMITGLPPRDHGVRLNGAVEGVPGLDTIVESAVRSDLSVRIRSRRLPLFGELLRPPAQVSTSTGRWSVCCELAAERTLAHLTHGASGRELRLFHIEEVDHEGHEHGAASAEYAEAALHAGEFVNRLSQELDLERDVLWVVSDHGHRPEGGHGGDEPEVHGAFALAVGAKVHPGIELPPRPMRDVASTLAVLGGFHTPSANVGRPMTDMFDLSPEQDARARAEPFDQALGALCALAPHARCGERAELARRLAAGDATALDSEETLVRLVAGAREEALAAGARRGVSTRGTVAASGLTLVGLFLARRSARRDASAGGGRGGAWLGRSLGLWLVGVYGAAMWLQGYRPSFSGMTPREIFVPDAALAVGLALAVTLALARTLGAWAPRGTTSDQPHWILASVAGGFVVLASLAGCDPKTLPPPAAGVLVFQMGPAVLGSALLAAALTLLQARRPRGARMEDAARADVVK
jgi:hypothetical protein